MRDLRFGISAASSWAWGTSLVVGIEIAQTKGLLAFGIWATANAATLAVFGLVASHVSLLRAFDRPAIRAGAMLIQLFILVIQLNILARLAGGYVATAAGLAFVFLVYRRGLKTSVLSDNVLLPVVMLCLSVMVCAGAWGGVPRTVYPPSGTGDILWALWGATVLLCGPVGDVQHWQRAGRRAYTIGSLFFSAYMAMILFVSSFQFNAVMEICLILAAVCLTGSTMDSAAVALHAIAGKRAGTILAVLVCVFWAALAGVGLLELWAKAGIFRVLFAGAVLAVALRGRVNGNETGKDRG